MRKNNGFVLIFVLGFSIALTSIVLFFNYKVKKYVEFFNVFQNFFEMDKICETGFEIAKKIIEKDENNYDWIKEPLFEEKVFKIRDFELSINIEDESSKINVNKIIDEKGKTNTLLYEITKNLFSILGYSPSLLDYFLDWIDEDSIPRPFGGEDFTYTINGFNYTPPNRNILVLREILLINGYTKEILYGNEEKKGLINFITIYTDGKININTCKGEILNSMGFTKEQVSKILEEREIHPLDEGFLININRDVFLKNRSLIKYKSNCFHVLVKVKNKEGEEAKNQAILEKEKTVNFIKKGIL